MLVPMAIKSGENLRQLASLSAYIRVFYDFLTDGQYIWDTADKHVSAVTTAKGTHMFWLKQFNSEYIILGIASLIFLLLSFLLSLIYLHDQTTKCYLLFIGLAVIILAVYLLAVIYKKSNTKNNMMELSVEYIQKYLILAVEMGFIREDDLTNAWNELNPENKINTQMYFI